MYKSISVIIGAILLAISSRPLFAGEQEIHYSYKPLPPGAIRPEGWLRDWAEAARDGITGHLDERSNTFKKGWSGKHFRAAGVKPHGTGWPLEQCAYWLDGLVRLAYILDDEALIKKAKSRLDPIVDAVNKGKGDSLIYWRPKSELNDEFNNWAHSHMARALVAYYQATGDKRILDALVKVYRNYPLPDMSLEAQFQNVSGAVNIDPMIDTYLMSQDPQVLKNMKEYAERKSFADLVKNWRADKAPEGHNVVFYENARVPALFYQLTGDRQHLEATKRLLTSKYQRNGLPMGLTSGEEHQSGIGSTRYVETCNVACGGWTYYWLLRIEGDARYADRMEDIFFNAGPVPLSRDFQLVSYYQVPNRTEQVLKPADNALPEGIPRVCQHIYSKLANGPLCCVGNSNRIVPNYVEHMWMTAQDDSPVAMVYGPCKLKATVKGVPVQIESVTEYPFEESITMKVQAAKATEFSIGLRIPKWCDDPKISVNGKSVTVSPDKRGFVRLKRKWGADDAIRLTFPMRPKVVTGRETPIPTIPYHNRKEPSYHRRALYKQKNVSFPFAYVTYGPLLFSLPLGDKTPNEPTGVEKWNYALDVTPAEAESRIKVVRQKMKRPWNWPLDAPIKLVVDAKQFDWSPTMTQPLPSKPVTDGKPVKITLVPYDCTKFHITMFPITDRLDKSSAEPKRGGYFSKKQYVPHPLPIFKQVRDKMPAPIYDENPTYVRMYWKAWEIAFNNFYEPTPQSGYVSQFIDAAFNQSIFQWDTCFLTMFCNYAHSLVPGIKSLDNFYAKQYESGEVPREIIRKTGKDHPLWTNKDGKDLHSHWGLTHKRYDRPIKYLGREVPKPPPHSTLDAYNHPIFAWAELESYRVTGDKERLKQVYQPLTKYYAFFKKYIRQGNGLYMTDWASMDNSPRIPTILGGGTAVDTSSEMALFARQLAEMAELLGKKEDAANYRRDAEAVAKAINEKMWNPEEKFYYDLTLEGKQGDAKTIAAYWTLLAGVASDKQADALADHLKNPATFGRKHRVPTTSADAKGFNPKGGYWRGAVWAPTNTMVIRGLERYGKQDLANEIALEHLDCVAEVFKKTGTLWENYAPDTIAQGKPARPNFVGWTGIEPILYFIEYRIGLRPDAPNNQLNWKLTSNKRCGCERFRFNGHVVTLIAQPDEAQPSKVKITVESDGDFKLHVERFSKTWDFDVKKGKNLFELE